MLNSFLQLPSQRTAHQRFSEDEKASNEACNIRPTPSPPYALVAPVGLMLRAVLLSSWWLGFGLKDTKIQRQNNQNRQQKHKSTKLPSPRTPSSAQASTIQLSSKRQQHPVGEIETPRHSGSATQHNTLSWVALEFVCWARGITNRRKERKKTATHQTKRLGDVVRCNGVLWFCIEHVRSNEGRESTRQRAHDDDGKRWWKVLKSVRI